MIAKLNKKDRIELGITIILFFCFIALVVTFNQRVKGSSIVSLRPLPSSLSFSRHFMFDPQRNKGTAFLLDKAAGQIIQIQRDPFSFGLSGKANEMLASDLVLKGIIGDSDNPSAVINDCVLKTGEYFGEFKVVKILRESVVLENGASKLELKLNQ